MWADSSLLENTNSTLIETREVMSHTEMGCKFTITTTNDIKNLYGYTRFRISKKDIEHVHEVTLIIGGNVVDRVYPSARRFFKEDGDDYLLFEFTNKYQIPPLHFHATNLLVEKTTIPVKIMYDVVKTNENIDYPKKFKIKTTITQRMRGEYNPENPADFANLYVEGNVERLTVHLPDTYENVRYIHDDKKKEISKNFTKLENGIWVYENPGELWVYENPSELSNNNRFSIVKFDSIASPDKHDINIFADTEDFVLFMSGMGTIHHGYLK